MLRRERIDARDWSQMCAGVPLFAMLSDDERERMCSLATIFLAEKNVVCVQGVELTSNQLSLLAGLAVLPILNLDSDWYEGVKDLVIYPAEFVARREETDDDGVVHVRRMPLSGESWQRGPVILSWPDVEASLELDGYNVVVHEFAHKLDMLDGAPNGIPPLHRGMNRSAWAKACRDAFDRLNADLDAGRETVVDPYAAEEPGEFFAVLSEMFFERPLDLEEEYPAVYEQFRAFYRQDPAGRFSHSA
ncbi:MAG: hypothetical protein DWQ08_10015 [Proteobacteria bacterium]|nr:MAG: hypothetical protein DWQ08_10015 [Pseudomonadota bacterium]